jgi:uracil-DNA glycosylase family 4
VPPAIEHDVAAELEELKQQLESCGRCHLAESRTRLVFGEGDPFADLMFVGEAPGYHEDKQGRPFVGAAGKLLEELLASIGLQRQQVYITNVLKSRPPNNRDPQPEEVEACKPFLFTQIGLIQPKVICSLGNFATKLLSGQPTGITRVHGHPQVREVGGHRFYLYPIFHPAAALYTPSMLETLRADFLRLPDLLTSGPPAELAAAPSPKPELTPDCEPARSPAAHQQASLLDEPAPDERSAAEPQESAAGEQLGLF